MYSCWRLAALSGHGCTEMYLSYSYCIRPYVQPLTLTRLLRTFQSMADPAGVLRKGCACVYVSLVPDISATLHCFSNRLAGELWATLCHGRQALYSGRRNFGVTFSTHTSWGGTRAVNWPRYSPRSFSAYRSRTMACMCTSFRLQQQPWVQHGSLQSRCRGSRRLLPAALMCACSPAQTHAGMLQS